MAIMPERRVHRIVVHTAFQIKEHTHGNVEHQNSTPLGLMYDHKMPSTKPR